MRHFARFTPTIYWTTRARAPRILTRRGFWKDRLLAQQFTALPLGVGRGTPTVPAMWSYANLQFRSRVGMFHARALPTAGCVIHRCELARVSDRLISGGGNINKDLESLLYHQHVRMYRAVFHWFNLTFNITFATWRKCSGRCKESLRLTRVTWNRMYL